MPSPSPKNQSILQVGSRQHSSGLDWASHVRSFQVKVSVFSISTRLAQLGHGLSSLVWMTHSLASQGFLSINFPWHANAGRVRSRLVAAGRDKTSQRKVLYSIHFLSAWRGLAGLGAAGRGAAGQGKSR